MPPPELGIARGEAEKYIRNYFARYSGVRRFIDRTIAEVRQSGVTRTLFGRERPIPDMNSRNPSARGFAERTAVNSPLQGSAADLIKLAMVRIDAALELGGHQTAMLLQVHDELVFECPPEEVDAVRALVKREMEGAYQLQVPLLVDTGVGINWRVPSNRAGVLLHVWRWSLPVMGSSVRSTWSCNVDSARWWSSKGRLVAHPALP